MSPPNSLDAFPSELVVPLISPASPPPSTPPHSPELPLDVRIYFFTRRKGNAAAEEAGYDRRKPAAAEKIEDASKS